MSTIQFGGVISGLNTQGIIDALVAAKKQPLTDMQTKETNLTSQKAAYTELGTALDDLVTKVKYFTVTAAGARRVATSADTSIFTATAVTSTPVATYSVSIDRVATATQAVSMTSMGAAVTGAVDTSLKLSKANLATPITAGNMALTVDGTTVQFTVGDPATTTLQSLMDGIAGAVQTQLQGKDPGSTVAASIVNGQLQLSVSGSTTHDIAFGNVADTSNAATALGLKGQDVSGVLNPTITGTAYLDPALSSLNLPGSVTAGQITAVVDGVLVHYTVGDPTKTTLTQTLAGFSSAIQSQLRAGNVSSGGSVGADSGATVSATAVGNRLQLSISGAGVDHSLSFGGAGDASNALGILGIANSTASGRNPTVAGTTNLGVARMSAALDSAGLTGLLSTKTGALLINGVEIDYDTTGDSLSDIITRINSSNAGVIASVDRTNDQLILTRKDTGALAIDINDKSGNLGAMLNLAPGTTRAQTIGLTAQVTVDGRTVTSASNAVTNAIDGVTINAITKSPAGVPQALTVGVDQSGVTDALNQFITSFNALGDLLDKDTAQTPGQSGGTAGSAGPLASDPTAASLFLSLRETLFQPVGSSTINSLGAIGLSTGTVGSAVGTTDRLQLDTTQLASALSADPNQVSLLLDSATGPLGALVTKLNTMEDPSNQNSYVQAHEAGLTTEISDLQRQELDQQEMIDNYQAMIEAQYASMESTLALLQSQSAQINATLGISTSSSSGTTSSSSSSGLSSSSTNS